MKLLTDLPKGIPNRVASAKLKSFAALRIEGESLSASYENTGSFIDEPAYEATPHWIVDERGELKRGHDLGCYEITSCISRGGMGEIYLAQDRRLGRLVALKLLPSSVTKD